MSTVDLLTETFIKGVGKATGVMFVTGIVAGVFYLFSETPKTDETKSKKINFSGIDNVYEYLEKDSQKEELTDSVSHVTGSIESCCQMEPVSYVSGPFVSGSLLTASGPNSTSDKCAGVEEENEKNFKKLFRF